MPIRSRQFYATPNQPRLDRISAEHGSDIFIKDSLLLIRGQQLAAEVSRQQLQAEATVRQHAAHAGQGRWRRWQPKVLIGEAKITPQFVSETEIRWRLSDLSVAELQGVRAGVQIVQVLYPLVRSLEDAERLEQSDLESERSSRTNAVPFVLLPQIVDLHVGAVSRDDDQVVYAEITLEVDMLIGVNQKVFLFLNQMTMVQPAAYIFPAQRRSADGVIVSFLVREIVAGDYLVRVQVDGAESLLEIEGEAYGRPRLAIA